MSFQILRGSSMRLSEPTGLLLGAHLEPVLQEQDSRVDHRLLGIRRQLEEAAGLLGGAEPHDGFDAGAVVPAAVEDDDLTRSRKVRDVALEVHL